jgi:hypothetical protein
MEANHSKIEAVLKSLENMERASAPPFFTAKVMHRIFSPAETPGWQRWFFFRPAIVVASLCAFFLLNCWFIYASHQSTTQAAATQETSIQQLAYELNVTYNYTLTDK